MRLLARKILGGMCFVAIYSSAEVCDATKVAKSTEGWKIQKFINFQ